MTFHFRWTAIGLKFARVCKEHPKQLTDQTTSDRISLIKLSCSDGQTCCCSKVRTSSTSLSSRFSWEWISHSGGSSGYFSTYVNFNVASEAARKRQTAHVITLCYISTFKLSFFVRCLQHNSNQLWHAISLTFSFTIFLISPLISLTNLILNKVRFHNSS